MNLFKSTESKQEKSGQKVLEKHNNILWAKCLFTLGSRLVSKFRKLVTNWSRIGHLGNCWV